MPVRLTHKVTPVDNPQTPAKIALGEELARQRSLAQNRRPQRDTKRAFEPKTPRPKPPPPEP